MSIQRIISAVYRFCHDAVWTLVAIITLILAAFVAVYPMVTVVRRVYQ